MDYKQILSSKKYTISNIDEAISELRNDIKRDIEISLSDARTAERTGHNLIVLSAMMDARLIMKTVDYTVYENEGKPTDWVSWKEENSI